MTETVFRNARIVTPERIVEGALVIDGPLIAEIGEGDARAGLDMEGDLILPGLIELHTDHIESHYRVRPGVRWNPVFAAQAHDAQVAASGITTVFDALCVGMDEERLDPQELRALIAAVQDLQKKGLLRAEHFTHLRCEVSAPDVIEAFEGFSDEPSVRLVSLMDHTPGQRQFTSLDKHREYYQGRGGLSDAQYDDLLARRRERAERYSDHHRREIAERARARAIMLASHDDATEAHVAEAVRDGARLAEFPTTVEAARASREAGLAVLMGAPNIVRGRSHSGNVSAQDLAAAGLLDVLSSDYVPMSLLQAAFALPERLPGMTLPDAIRLVSKAPAEAVGLDDRGALEPGRRADFVRVRLDGTTPVVRAVHVKGERTA